MNMDFLKEQPYFLDAWAENVSSGPDQMFLTDEVQPQGMSRREADELSAKVYAWLKKQKIGKEDFVLVCLPRGIMIPLAMMGVACQAYPYIFNHTTIEVDNPFRVRTLGTMRQFHGIEGVDGEVVPIVNKGAACGLMNVQILAKKGGGQELRLTYNDQKYKKETAEKVLSLLCSKTESIMADQIYDL